MAICHRKAFDTEACGHDQRHQHQTQQPTAGLTHEARHSPRLCIRGTRTHIPTRASRTSSMHIPRAHEAARALKLPLKYLFFSCEHMWHIHPNFLHSFKCRVSWGLGPVFTFSRGLTWGGSPYEALLGYSASTCVFEPTYLSTCALPHLRFYFCDHRLHSLLLNSDRRSRSIERSTLLSAKQ